MEHNITNNMKKILLIACLLISIFANGQGNFFWSHSPLASEISIPSYNNIDYTVSTVLFQPIIPSSVRSGDLIIIYAILSTNSTVTNPSGFSVLGKNEGDSNYNSYALYYKIASSSERE